MFSGIIEATASILNIEKNGAVLHIYVERPRSFDDIHIGDSIATNGVCLTLEEFDSQQMRFSIGPETLRITRWAETLRPKVILNLERSLRYGDRIHGHMVTGHVDAQAQVIRVQDEGESLFFDIEIPQEFQKYVWPKGSLCVSGVSLTINEVHQNILSFCLVPETLRQTNLRELRTMDLSQGNFLNIEFDYMSKAITKAIEARQ